MPAEEVECMGPFAPGSDGDHFFCENCSAEFSVLTIHYIIV
jgi:hypothetical protein